MYVNSHLYALYKNHWDKMIEPKPFDIKDYFNGNLTAEVWVQSNFYWKTFCDYHDVLDISRLRIRNII